MESITEAPPVCGHCVDILKHAKPDDWVLCVNDERHTYTLAVAVDVAPDNPWEDPVRNMALTLVPADVAEALLARVMM